MGHLGATSITPGLLIIEIESDNRAASRGWITALSFSAPARAVPVSSLMPLEKRSASGTGANPHIFSNSLGIPQNTI